MTAKLALEDGTVYYGRAFGSNGTVSGEVVFNTAMTGYQETLTDPSYRGQIVTMTYPLIGNYGTTNDDQESDQVQVEGFVVRELCRMPSNFRSTADLDTLLRKSNVVGLEGIDTRSLVRRIRTRGAMRAVLTTEAIDNATLIQQARTTLEMKGRDVVSELSQQAPFAWDKGFGDYHEYLYPTVEADRHVVAIDYGMKWNILRHLTQSGFKVTVVPSNTTSEDVLKLKPDGVFLSNGPGDPGVLNYAVETVHSLLGKVPIFGICLGHQVLGQAFGAMTFKLKFGHRGVNQPVLNQRSGQVEITSQNHGFAVDDKNLPSDVETTHINLNDRTVEGLRHKTHPAFSVQYHPEAAAGPHDSSYLFAEFRSLMG